MDREDIEGPLIEENVNKNEILGELKRLLVLAGPLMSVNFLLSCLQAVCIMFVGHLGELSLSGASMATSFASVSGLSLLLGLASALDTLCGQSYGAKQYHMQRAMLVLLLASVFGLIFLQAQKNVIPMMFSAGITTLLHIFTCWILVFKSGLGNKGLEIWSFEMMVLLSGLLPNPKLETSVLSIRLDFILRHTNTNLKLTSQRVAIFELFQP
uniref:Protein DETOXIFICATION n=1 Tax=Solanum lycopersicum TaxID=4081 RepID=A0A3Q7H703_SOLLC